MTTPQLADVIARLRELLEGELFPWSAQRRGDDCATSAIAEALDRESWPFVINVPSPPFAFGSTGAAVSATLGRDGKRTATGDAEAARRAALIVAAVNALPALLSLADEVERLQGDYTRLKSAYAAIESGHGYCKCHDVVESLLAKCEAYEKAASKDERIVAALSADLAAARAHQLPAELRDEARRLRASWPAGDVYLFICRIAALGEEGR